MSAWSYFWDYQNHLSNAAFGLEISGAAVEVIVGIAIVSTFHKEWDEKIKKRLEFLFEVAFLGAALIALIAIASNRRIETLRKKDEQAAEAEIKNQRGQAQAAAKTASAASANATAQAEKLAGANAKVTEVEAALQPRRITIIQREKFMELLKAEQKGPVIVCYGVENQETLDFAHDLSDMLANAGYPTGPARFIHSWGMRLNPPHPDISIATCIFTNVPIPEYMQPIANAFRMIGFTNVAPNMMVIGQFRSSKTASETPMAIFVNGRTY